MSADPANGTDLASKTFACTFGAHTQTTWTDRRSVPWQDLIAILTTHTVGRKEGTCIVPAVFRGDRRHKADAEQIDTAFLDSDGGATLEDIAAAVRLSHQLAGAMIAGLAIAAAAPSVVRRLKEG